MVQLRLLEDSAGDPGEVKQVTGQLRTGLRAALDDLRALARVIYPPLLADQGLGPALRAQAGRAPLPVLVETDGIDSASGNGTIISGRLPVPELAVTER